MPHSQHDSISLNKAVSASGFCSRRAADELIAAGRVTINNRPAGAGARVNDGDTVEIDGEKIKGAKKQERIYLALNKPPGITSTTDLKDRTNIIDFINYPKRIFPVGRLDKDSDGLIFLTNDGDIVNKILRASNQHQKEYIVTVDKAIDETFVQRMAGGLPILDEITKPCFVRKEGSRRFRIILTQGLNRQIRRMCTYLGYEVKTLTRVAIMHIQLGNLAPGKWRYFTAPEVDKLMQLIGASSNVAEEQGSKKQHTNSTYIPSRKKTAGTKPPGKHQPPVENRNHQQKAKPGGKRRTR